MGSSVQYCQVHTAHWKSQVEHCLSVISGCGTKYEAGRCQESGSEEGVTEEVVMVEVWERWECLVSMEQGWELSDLNPTLPSRDWCVIHIIFPLHLLVSSLVSLILEQ